MAPICSLVVASTYWITGNEQSQYIVVAQGAERVFQQPARGLGNSDERHHQASFYTARRARSANRLRDAVVLFSLCRGKLLDLSELGPGLTEVDRNLSCRAPRTRHPVS